MKKFLHFAINLLSEENVILLFLRNIDSPSNQYVTAAIIFILVNILKPTINT